MTDLRVALVRQISFFEDRNGDEITQIRVGEDRWDALAREGSDTSMTPEELRKTFVGVCLSVNGHTVEVIRKETPE